MEKNIVKRVKVQEEESDIIQKYSFEMQGFSAEINQFTFKNEFEVNQENYRELLKAYIESYATYQYFWAYLIKKYVPKEYMDDTKYQYMIDFSFDEIHIYKIEDKGECSCNGNCSK